MRVSTNLLVPRLVSYLISIVDFRAFEWTIFLNLRFLSSLHLSVSYR